MHELSLLRDFAVILVVAGAVSVVFRRLNQPVVLGYLIAGYIVGPHSPPFAYVENEDVVRSFADFGIVLLMFGLGLEFSLDRIRKVGFVAVVGAIVEVTVMLVLGYLLGRAFGWTPMEATFLGAALSISSTAIIVKVLQELGRMDAESSRIMFGILVVEDFIAVAMMTVLAGVGNTGEVSLGEVGQLSLKLVSFTVVSLALGLRLFARFVDYVAALGSKEVLVVLVIGAAFGMALFADQLGLSIAAGAFIIGAITAETRNHAEIHRLSEPIRDIFGALFFVAMGMLIDLNVLGQYIIPVLLIVPVMVVGKLCACYVGVFLSGYRKRTAFEVGAGMAQVGEFSLVLTKIGTETGATGAFLQPLMAVVSGITALTTPYFIRSTNFMYGFIGRVMPRVIKRRSDDMEFWARRIQGVFTEDSPTGRRGRHSLLVIFINVVIIGALLLGAERAIELLQERRLLGLSLDNLTLLLGGGALFLCVIPLYGIWRSLRVFFEVVLHRVALLNTAAGVLRQRRLMDTLPLATATGVIVIISLEAVPLAIRVLTVTQPLYLIPFGVVAIGLMWMVWGSVERFHTRVEGFIELSAKRRAEARRAGRRQNQNPQPAQE